MHELGLAASQSSATMDSVAATRVGIDEQARQLRKDIESLQAGAGAITRQGQQLREKKAQLESLRSVSAQRATALAGLLKRRGEALDRLEKVREDRFKARVRIAGLLNKTLGPRIKIEVTRAGRFEAFAAAIAEVLRGSGLRYGDLAPALAERMSPRERFDAADVIDYGLIADAAGISRTGLPAC